MNRYDKSRIDNNRRLSKQYQGPRPLEVLGRKRAIIAAKLKRYKEIMAEKSAPRSQLRLEWVYGYRGHQCRNNLFYINQDEIVYFVAGVGIVRNLQKQTQKFFLGHTDDIVSLALHPKKTLVATGQVGKEPYICIWDTNTMKTVSILKDQHTHGVACLSFSQSGEKLVSVGLDGHNTLIIWEWRKGRMVATAKGHTDRVFDVSWDPASEQRLATCGVKHIKFWSLCGNTLTGKRGVFGKTGDMQTILCVACSEDQLTYTGTFNGDIYVWRDNNLEKIISSSHAGAIITMHKCIDGFATGSKDGFVKLWDSNFTPLTSLSLLKGGYGYKGLAIRSVCWSGDRILAGTQNSEIFQVSVDDKDSPVPLTQGHSEGELWGLSVHPLKPIAATASDDCSLRLWSLIDHALLTRCNLSHPARSCAFNADGTAIAVGCKNGSFSVFKTRDMSEVVSIHNRKEVIHEMKYSPDGSYLAVASNDNFVDVYVVAQRYKQVGTCGKSSSFITHIDWSKDSTYLQTNDGAGERLVYAMPGGKHVTSADEIRAVKWQSWTCVLGSEVNGIWPKYTQINDINTVDACFSKDVVATGDDFGLVKLFRFPCWKKACQFRKYTGHAAHVTNVRFSFDDRWLISTGGADHAVFQWLFVTDGTVLPSDDDLSAQDADNSDTCSEASNSDLSDVDEVDSDVEQETQINYNRQFYKEDVAQLKLKAKNETDGVSRKKKKSNSTDGASLKLEFVHGYRGYDCRDNVFYTQKGEIVYHVAALGILYSRSKCTQRFYDKHDDDILCLNLHPLKDIVATGQIGRDAAIHVWDADTLTTISVLKGFHQRGVTAVDFSDDGKKLASIGLDNDHSMAIWDWKRGQKLATTKTHQDKVFVVRFNSSDPDKLVTVGVRHIKFWQHVGGGCTAHRGTFGDVGKLDTMLCVAYDKSGNAYSGSANGQIYVWQSNRLARTQRAHDGPCFAIHALDKGFVTGGKDGIVCLWDEKLERCLKTYPIANDHLVKDIPGQLLQNHPTVRAITLGHGKILVGTKNGEILEVDKSGPVSIIMQGHSEGEVWGLAFHPTKPECATISNDKTVRKWSTVPQQQRMLVARKFPVGGKCCAYSPDGNAIAIGCNDGSFQVLSASALDHLVTFHHRKEAISDIRFSPSQGKYVAVASHDNFVDIYNVLDSSRVGVCKGASSYITHIDWDARGKLLCVNSGAKELLYFEAPRGKRQTISSDESIEWSSWTGVLGKTCQGIWPSYSDVTDVNATCLSQDRKLLVTGDDFGFVKLFKYPVKEKNASCKKYVGHSAHVTNVRWSHDSSQVASTGGADTALFLWTRENIEIASSSKFEAGPSNVEYRGDSDDSDTDSEEEGGYDSDVARENSMDYSSKIYASNIRDTTGTKPNAKDLQPVNKPAVSRGLPETERVLRSGKVAVNRVTELELHHVFGYRGFDCRDNLHYVNDGSHIVFHAAGAGILQDVSSAHQQTFYLEHTDDIISLTVNQHPKFPNVIATGQLGESPKIHVWDAISKKTLSILKGCHEVGVCSVNFSASGKLLLSVGLEEQHSVAVWRWQEGALVSSHPCNRRRIFSAQFRPDSDTNFVTVGVKHVMFWKVCGTALLGKRGVLGATAGIQAQTMLSMAFGADNHTYTGAMNGDVYVWKDHVLQRTVAKAHTGPVFSMHTTLRDGLIVTGGKNTLTKEGGSVKLWDQEMKRCRAFKLPSNSVVKSVSRGKGKIVVGTRDSEILELTEKSGSSMYLAYGHMEGEIWGLACHPGSMVCCTTSLDKTARIWDLSGKILLHSISLTAGSRACAFSHDGQRIVVGQENGEVLVLDVVSCKVLAKKRDRKAAIYDVRFSPNDNLIAVSSQQTLDFYEIGLENKFARVGYCKQIPSFVFQVDFSKDGKYIQAGTGAYKHMVFEVPSGKQVTDIKIINKITWETWTSVLGDDVIGIWPKNCVDADVNCANVTHGGNAVATGDDFGFVKLFDFPCKEKFARHQKYVGHSAHVTNARFVCDDSKLVTTGGDDCCVFVWKCS